MRKVALGLVLSALMMNQLAIPMVKWFGTNDGYYGFALALNSMSDAVGHMLGLQFIIPIVMTLLCLGAGLLLSDLLCALADVSGGVIQKSFTWLASRFRKDLPHKTSN